MHADHKADMTATVAAKDGDCAQRRLCDRDADFKAPRRPLLGAQPDETLGRLEPSSGHAVSDEQAAPRHGIGSITSAKPP